MVIPNRMTPWPDTMTPEERAAQKTLGPSTPTTAVRRMKQQIDVASRKFERASDRLARTFYRLSYEEIDNAFTELEEQHEHMHQIVDEFRRRDHACLVRTLREQNTKKWHAYNRYYESGGAEEGEAEPEYEEVE